MKLVLSTALGSFFTVPYMAVHKFAIMIVAWAGPITLVSITLIQVALNRIKDKYMLENKKLSDREKLYEFLRRIPIQRSYNSVCYCYRESRFK